jgi:hypothetical protein
VSAAANRRICLSHVLGGIKMAAGVTLFNCGEEDR